MNQVKEKNLTNSNLSANRPSPGLTLESLSFKNFPKNIQSKRQFIHQKQLQPKQQTKENKNLNKYTKSIKNDELQKNIANYELFFEKNNLNKNPKKVKSGVYNNSHDIYYPKNYKDSNAEILSKILDSNEEFSPNAPSNLKIYQNELNDINNKNNLQTSNNNNNNEEKKQQTQNSENEININPTEIYYNALSLFLTEIDPIFDTLSLNEKIEKFLTFTTDERRPIRMGALVAIYLTLKKYTKDVDDDHRAQVIEKMVTLLQSYEKQEELFLVACLEICSLYGPTDILIENLSLICMFITDFNFPRLQKATFNCLMCMEYEGIRTLVELASKDYQDYQNYILNNLIQTPHIQKIIIIRALLNELYSNSSQRRNIGLSALNRLHDLVNDPDTLEKLDNFFNEPKISKEFIASILRTSGIEGEDILLEELKNNKNFEVRRAIANALSYRIPKNPNYLEIRLDKNDTNSVCNNLPGSFCKYFGNISPVIEMNNKDIDKLLEQEELNEDNDDFKTNINNNNNTQYANNNTEEYLEVNTRDFLAALQRMLSMNYEHEKPQIVYDKENNFNLIDTVVLKSQVNTNSNKNNNNTNNNTEENEEENEENTNSNNINNNINPYQTEVLTKHAPFFEIISSNTQNSSNLNENGNYFIEEEVTKALTKCLKDYSPKVRESAATSLGLIGLPEALLSIDGLIENIEDEDVNVRSKIIWAIGRVAQGTDKSVVPFIINAVQNNMWKVKKAALYTLSQYGDRAKNSLPYLVKLLKESAINKQLVATTMVKIGLEGESVLLKIMSSEPDNNYKLKSAIVRALAYTDITSTNIDFIVECIFKQGKNSFSLVRKSAIFSIRVLAEKAEEKITYLKRKNIIPFYYDKLKDKDTNIQSYAINCIKSLGPQGELIFIEGFTKDPNPIIRTNCGIGLAESGVQTLRTLLIGLHDENDTVRNTIEKVIVVKMNIPDVVSYFAGQDQLGSLKISVKDILEKNKNLSMFTVNYFNQLLNYIEKYEAENKDNFNDNVNSDHNNNEDDNDNNNNNQEHVEENEEEYQAEENN